VKFSYSKIALYSFLGAVLWTLHFMLIYAVAEFGCLANWPWLGWAIIILTIIFFAGTIWALWKSIKYYENREAFRLNPSAIFLARFGIFNNAIFAFIIFYQSFPYFYFKGECF
jgi:uncharacterized SAM-binding protein YcdF (DUF218 family)